MISGVSWQSTWVPSADIRSGAAGYSREPAVTSRSDTAENSRRAEQKPIGTTIIDEASAGGGRHECLHVGDLAVVHGCRSVARLTMTRTPLRHSMARLLVRWTTLLGCVVVRVQQARDDRTDIERCAIVSGLGEHTENQLKDTKKR